MRADEQNLGAAVDRSLHSRPSTAVGRAAAGATSETQSGLLVEPEALPSAPPVVIGECVICYEPMWKHENIEALPCARSIFHSACIGSWLKKRRDFPIPSQIRRRSSAFSSV